MSLNIAILASGSGSNAQAIMDKIAAGLLDARIVTVLCNRPGAGVIARAEKAGIPCQVLDHTQFADRESFDRRMVAALQEAGAELVVLAGYMRLLTAPFLDAFAMRVVNVHPAVLPSFPGLHGAQDAVDYGVRISGCTVHFVEEKMDSGPVIIQAAVPVNPEECAKSLQQRIQSLEHRIYPQAIQWLAEKRITLDGRRTRLAPGAAPRSEDRGDWLVWPPLEQGF